MLIINGFKSHQYCCIFTQWSCWCKNQLQCHQKPAIHHKFIHLFCSFWLCCLFNAVFTKHYTLYNNNVKCEIKYNKKENINPLCKDKWDKSFSLLFDVLLFVLICVYFDWNFGIIICATVWHSITYRMIQYTHRLYNFCVYDMNIMLDGKFNQKFDIIALFEEFRNGLERGNSILHQIVKTFKLHNMMKNYTKIDWTYHNIKAQKKNQWDVARFAQSHPNTWKTLINTTTVKKHQDSFVYSLTIN